MKILILIIFLICQILSQTTTAKNYNVNLDIHTVLDIFIKRFDKKEEKEEKPEVSSPPTPINNNIYNHYNNSLSGYNNAEPLYYNPYNPYNSNTFDSPEISSKLERFRNFLKNIFQSDK